MKAWSIYPVRFLLMAACEKPEGLTQEQREAAGITARRLFEFALEQSPRDDALVRSGIEGTCRTFESNPTESEVLLRRILPEQHLKNYGYRDMPVLAQEIARLVALAPALVRDVYITAFRFEESRDEQTSMGPGKIMSLNSNRRQDYGMAQWQLGENFSSFLKYSPKHAVEALVGVLSSEVKSQRPEEAIDFFEMRARIREDLSHIWDVTQYRHEAHLRMLDEFESELLRTGSNPNLSGSFNMMLSSVVQYNSYAAVWRRILSVGIREPKAIGTKVSALAWAIPVLTCPDTSHLVGEFIKAIYSELDSNAREKIEKAILAIPATLGPEDAEAANHIRNRLIGCVPAELLCTQLAKELLQGLVERGGTPKNLAPYRVESSFRPYTEKEFLAEQGVPVDDSPNRKIRELTEPLQKFTAQYLNSAPPWTETESLLSQARGLHDVLQSSPSVAHKTQLDNGWSHLVSFCARAARCEQLDGATESGRFVRDILLKGANDQSPTTDAHWVEEFDEHPSWSPAPRIDAADGLLFLAYRPTFVDAEVLSAIKRLSVDYVPAVRLQVADRLGTLTKTAPDLMKELLSNILRKDPSSSVVLGALNHQLWRIMPEQPEFTEDLVFDVLNRKDLRGRAATDVRLFCVVILLELFMWKGLPRSSARIQDICSSVGTNRDEAARIVSHLREVLVMGLPEFPEPQCDTARLRALQLCETIIANTQGAFVKFQDDHKRVAFEELSIADKNYARDLAQLLDSISSQLYFASGAFDEKPQGNNLDKHPLSLSQRRRFLREAGRCFDLLAKDPHPSVVHHLIQTLQALMDLEPREVFLRIATLVKAGKPGGYQYESLAIGVIVAMVNRVFADFRPMLQENEDVRLAMVELLDVFVDAGWTQAIHLTYRLDEVFR